MKNKKTDELSEDTIYDFQAELFKLLIKELSHGKTKKD